MNTSVSTHDAPFAIVVPQVLPVISKSAGLLLVYVTPVASAVPVLATVTLTGADVAPTLVAGKESVPGVVPMAGSFAGITATLNPVPPVDVQVKDTETPSVSGSCGSSA